MKSGFLEIEPWIAFIRAVLHGPYLEENITPSKSEGRILLCHLNEMITGLINNSSVINKLCQTLKPHSAVAGGKPLRETFSFCPLVQFSLAVDIRNKGVMYLVKTQLR